MSVDYQKTYSEVEKLMKEKIDKNMSAMGLTADLKNIVLSAISKQGITRDKAIEASADLILLASIVN